MASKRRLSAPVAPTPPPSSTALPSPESILVDSTCTPSSSNAVLDAKLLDRAEKLARMTMELKIHKVVMQANDLARGLEDLTRKTVHNESFRQQNEERMEKVWQDVLSVKANFEQHLDARARDELHLGEYQREVVEVKSSMGEVRKLVEELAGKVDQLPTLAEANAVLAGVCAQREACESAAAVCRERCELGVRAGCSHKPIQTRIQETIKSTRRWHHDHKSTALPDAVFTANYLKKQSKRDPRMAVYLQRAIHKRIRRRRRRGSGPQPQSLEEFCQDVSWEDVTRTVEDVLVRRVDSTVQSLSQSSG
ncbi:hypothetical protein X797_003860 [Metarhizium robertsii]|uniref:Uncharacterized protein n=2 Tax=Metarhizium robertsii TaxID=568076 RepID=E9EVK2_METRA|nr:uncharacterized protein MAA_04051 [Metarhizium robertsii ARSEF 23]EFZ00274.2 hypothetical protein MAA_04051 [Metarhizium robertsii ARSEF 23]EXV02738.1 hypothetical protein X797_003860 [Metarhizium robertsii]